MLLRPALHAILVVKTTIKCMLACSVVDVNTPTPRHSSGYVLCSRAHLLCSCHHPELCSRALRCCCSRGIAWPCTPTVCSARSCPGCSHRNCAAGSSSARPRRANGGPAPAARTSAWSRCISTASTVSRPGAPACRSRRAARACAPAARRNRRNRTSPHGTPGRERRKQRGPLSEAAGFTPTRAPPCRNSRRTTRRPRRSSPCSAPSSRR